MKTPNLLKHWALSLCMAFTSLVQAQVPAQGGTVAPNALFTDPNEVMVARRFGEAIQAVNWRTTNELAARKSIELAIQPFGWRFKNFELIEPSVDIPRRLIANLSSTTCPTAATWAAALGRPVSLDLRSTHSIITETRLEVIDRLIRHEELVGTPIRSMHYPLHNQSDYRFEILGGDACLKGIIVSPSKMWPRAK